MTANQELRPQHRPAADRRSVEALTVALRALRHVQDEQMRMWEAFYQIGTWDTRPQTHIAEQPRSPAGSDSGRPPASSGPRAA